MVKEGETAEVQALVGIIAEADDDISSLLNGSEKNVSDEDAEVVKEAVPVKEQIERSESGYAAATPYAKKLAGERGIDLNKVPATGYNGVIVARDVENAEIDEIKIKVTPTARKMAEDKGINLADIYTGTKIRKADILELDEKQVSEDEFETEKASSMRKIIAQKMRATWAGTPMLTFNMEADMTELIKLRERLKSIYAKEGLKLTYNHIIMKILSRLLLKYRYLNASFEDDKIIYHRHVNLGIAVDVERGLMVPNVKGIEKMTMREIA